MWEQWGLLGLIVGAFFAFGGGDLIENVPENVEAAMASLPIGAAMVGQNMAGAEQAAETAEATGEALAALESGAAGASPGAFEFVNVLRAAVAGVVGAIAGFAGLVADGLSQSKDKADDPDKYEKAFSRISSFTPGTVQQAFDKFDRDKSGTLDRVELEAAFKELNLPPSKADIAQLFQRLDEDGDGLVTLNEWVERLPMDVKSIINEKVVKNAKLKVQAVPVDRPMSAIALGGQNFEREWKQLVHTARYAGTRRRVPSFVPSLLLSNEAVSAREHARPQVPTPGPVKAAYDVLCWFIDVVFADRPIARFWFLETVARMPYWAYTSVLHLYETLGWWRSPELRLVHNAEEDNELHHLLIMESLGGDQRWLDRFFAQHGAIAYYWLLVLFFFVDPRWSYNFSRLLEAHAVDTYGEFVDVNEKLLKSLPPPPIAVEYYLAGDLYFFDKSQPTLKELRRPPCATLYDVFANIRDDEEQHVLTMKACEEWVAGGEPAVPLGFNRLSDKDYERLVSSSPEGRAAWQRWGEEVALAAREAGRLPVEGAGVEAAPASSGS